MTMHMNSNPEQVRRGGRIQALSCEIPRCLVQDCAKQSELGQAGEHLISGGRRESLLEAQFERRSDVVVSSAVDATFR
jgi:hypothetical protein